MEIVIEGGGGEGGGEGGKEGEDEGGDGNAEEKEDNALFTKEVVEEASEGWLLGFRGVVGVGFQVGFVASED